MGAFLFGGPAVAVYLGRTAAGAAGTGESGMFRVRLIEQ